MHFDGVRSGGSGGGTPAAGAVRELLGEETGVFPPVFGHREE